MRKGKLGHGKKRKYGGKEKFEAQRRGMRKGKLGGGGDKMNEEKIDLMHKEQEINEERRKWMQNEQEMNDQKKRVRLQKEE